MSQLVTEETEEMERYEGSNLHYLLYKEQIQDSHCQPVQQYQVNISTHDPELSAGNFKLFQLHLLHHIKSAFPDATFEASQQQDTIFTLCTEVLSANVNNIQHHTLYKVDKAEQLISTHLFNINIKIQEMKRQRMIMKYLRTHSFTLCCHYQKEEMVNLVRLFFFGTRP